MLTGIECCRSALEQILSHESRICASSSLSRSHPLPGLAVLTVAFRAMIS